MIVKELIHMKLFSYTKSGYSSVGIELDNSRIDFNKAVQQYNRKGKHNIPQLLNLKEILELGYYKKFFLTKLVSFVHKNKLEKKCQVEPHITFEVPILNPQKIICLGLNYAEHAKEFGAGKTKLPLIFAKLPSSLQSHSKAVIIPSFEQGRVDHELELAIIIGKKGKNISQDNAEKFIAGYTILNDMTARTQQKKDMQSGKPWIICKSYDTFTPLGPYFTPQDFIIDPNNLELLLTVNGKSKQHSNTSNMILKIPGIIEYVSKYFTLYPGDIIATGTPEGISGVKDGDAMEASIEGIGSLNNKVVKEKE